MGFAETREWHPKTPRYHGTVVCPNCEAEYDPSVAFVTGYYKDGDTSARGGRVVVNHVPKGACPVCYRMRDAEVTDGR